MLELIKPDWPVAAHVKALSTTRIAGGSAAPFDSFNLGAHVGDKAEHVAQNRAVLRKQLGLTKEPFWLEQTHSTAIATVEDGDGSVVTADASYARGPNRACVVMTADCLPLLLSDEGGTQVAAVHAGWRGMAAGIIESVVKQFDGQANNIFAWLGPCIGPQAFEVGVEVRDQLGGPEHAYRPHIDKAKTFANLQELAHARLLKLGVQGVYRSQLCTFADARRFFSYRRDGQTGRMATLIWIENAQK